MNKIELTGLLVGLALFIAGIAIYIVQFSTVDKAAPILLSGATLIFLLTTASIMKRNKAK